MTKNHIDTYNDLLPYKHKKYETNTLIYKIYMTFYNKFKQDKNIFIIDNVYYTDEAYISNLKTKKYNKLDIPKQIFYDIYLQIF